MKRLNDTIAKTDMHKRRIATEELPWNGQKKQLLRLGFKLVLHHPDLAPTPLPRPRPRPRQPPEFLRNTNYKWASLRQNLQ